jgi:hypothetical protein
VGWAGKQNGGLLRLAGDEFDLFVTSGRTPQHQQNLSATTLAVVVLAAKDKRLDTLQPLRAKVRGAAERIPAGEAIRIET